MVHLHHHQHHRNCLSPPSSFFLSLFLRLAVFPNLLDRGFLQFERFLIVNRFNGTDVLEVQSSHFEFSFSLFEFSTGGGGWDTRHIDVYLFDCKKKKEVYSSRGFGATSFLPPVSSDTFCLSIIKGNDQFSLFCFSFHNPSSFEF